MRPIPATALLAICLVVPAHTQTVERHIAMGDSLHDALEPAEALEHYRAALVLDSADYEALWKFTRSQVDVAKQIDDDGPTQRRDSMYAVARSYAERAVRADSLGADGHFALALALGQLSLTQGGRERIRFARLIYDEAAKAVELDPDHGGAYHILGAWHAEVRRLSGLTRFLAKTLFGGGFMGRASWDSAVVHLERSVALRGDYLHHRLELAEVYLDLDRLAEARYHLAHPIKLPPTTDVLDPEYRESAQRLLRKIRERTGIP